MSTELTPEPHLRLDENGIPILDEVLEEGLFDELAAEIKGQLLTELEPLVNDLARVAFANSVRVVALELKRTFEQELDRLLETRLKALVEESVERACRARQ